MPDSTCKSSSSSLTLPLLEDPTSRGSAFYSFSSPSREKSRLRPQGNDHFPELEYDSVGVVDRVPSRARFFLSFRPSSKMRCYQKGLSAAIGTAPSTTAEDSANVPKEGQHRSERDSSPSLPPQIPILKKRRIDVDVGPDTIDYDPFVNRVKLEEASEAPPTFLEEVSHAIDVNTGRTTSTEVDSEPAILLQLRTPKPVYPHKSIEGNKMYISNVRQAYDSWNVSYNHHAVTAAFNTAAAVRSIATLQGKGHATASSATCTRSFEFDPLSSNHEEHDFSTVGATFAPASTTSTPARAKKMNVATAEEFPYNFSTPTNQRYHTPVHKERKNYTFMTSSNDSPTTSRNINPIGNHPFLESYLRGPPPLRRRNEDGELW